MLCIRHQEITGRYSFIGRQVVVPVPRQNEVGILQDDDLPAGRAKPISVHKEVAVMTSFRNTSLFSSAPPEFPVVSFHRQEGMNFWLD